VEFLLLGLLVLALPVVAVAALTLAIVGRRRTETLEKRVAFLERELTRRTPLPSDAAARPAAEPAPSSPLKSAATGPAALPEPSVASATRSTPAISAMPDAAPKRSLEERLGARWTVVVGGLALALGGVFLVRYSIEQGWIGPAARVALGALFACGLLALGERMRRAEARRDAPRPPIDIPAAVTSAGAVSAFAVVYAAYALYGFIGPAAAFPLLGAVAVATMLAALLHGPTLGALGLLGAYGVPLLVSSEEPNVWALLIYLLAPTAAAFAVARIRRWPQLAIGAGVAAFLWGAAALVTLDGAAGPTLAYAFALTGLAALLHTGGRLIPPEPSIPSPIPCALIGLYGLLAMGAPAIDGFGSAAIVAAGALFVLHLALGVWAAGLTPVAVIGGALAVLTALSFDDAALAAVAEATSLPAPGEIARAAGLSTFFAFAAVLGAIYLFGGGYAARRAPGRPDWRAGLLAASAVATPLAMLAFVYWKAVGLAPDLRFAGLAVLLGAAFAFAADDASRREAKGDASGAVTASFATGAAAALGLALAMAMREGALTVALAFLAAALGFVATARPIRALGALAVIAAGLVLVRIALDPRIVGDDLSSTPVFNALLWGYGAPAAAFWAASRFFARAGQVRPSQILEGAALVFALLLGFTEARHFARDGDMAATGPRLLESGLDATVAFGLAAVAGRLNLKRASPVLGWGGLAASALGCLLATLGLLFGANPALTGEPVGESVVLNALLPGYLLPAIAAFAAASFAAEDRPVWVRRTLGGVALVLALAWATLTVRQAFVGAVLSGPEIGDAEMWAYSAVWLACGLALLGTGVLRRSQMLRLGSAVVLIVVTIKVFLFDLAGLGGVWRALSFIGLGGVLIGIGAIYQRLLFPRTADAR
jgi:uncharacterized membrane protein